MWDPGDQDITPDSVGQNVYEVFGRHKGAVDLHLYKEPIESILNGSHKEISREHHIDGNGRWFRTRFLPVSTREDSDPSRGLFVNGVIGISMDITELKGREAEIKAQEAENMRLLAAETAANEANRIKR